MFDIMDFGEYERDPEEKPCFTQIIKFSKSENLLYSFSPKTVVLGKNLMVYYYGDIYLQLFWLFISSI